MTVILRRRSDPRPARPELLGAVCVCGAALGEVHPTGSVQLIRRPFIAPNGTLTTKCTACGAIVPLPYSREVAL